MPIPRAKLQELQRPMRERVVAFLKSQPEEAFTAVEIYSGIEGISKDSVAIAIVFEQKPDGLKQVDEALASLLNAGDLDVAQYQGDRYYTLRSP